MGKAASAKPRSRFLRISTFFDGLKRLYGLLLIAIVLWLSWRAFRYLLLALLTHTAAPPQILDVPRRPAETLQPAPQGFAGVMAVEHARTPVSHFHRVDGWFQPDRFNNCTQSGCHAPLPHGRNKADRAFLNMHATSLHCGVCHLKTDAAPLPLTWYDLDSGRRTDPPALLGAFALAEELGEQTPETLTEEQGQELTRRLEAAARQSGETPQLRTLAEHFAATRVDSELFGPLLQAARTAIPRHFRGEYGAKLALVDRATGRPILGHPGGADAIREYLATKDKLSEAERAAVLTRVHPARRSPTLTCTDCHRAPGSLVDLTTVGYPPARVRQLANPLITQMIEHMMQGQTFDLPGFIAPPGTVPPEPNSPPMP
jgi:hypothetical protein